MLSAVLFPLSPQRPAAVPSLYGDQGGPAGKEQEAQPSLTICLQVYSWSFRWASWKRLKTISGLFSLPSAPSTAMLIWAMVAPFNLGQAEGSLYPLGHRTFQETSAKSEGTSACVPAAPGGFLIKGDLVPSSVGAKQYLVRWRSDDI